MSSRISSPRRRGPRITTMLLAVTVLAVVLGVGWGLDTLIRVGAQSVIARVVQARTGVTERPTVKVQGDVFVWQAVRGRYDEITIDLHNLQVGALRIAEVQAAAYGVHVPFHQVLVRNLKQVYIEGTHETAVLRYGEINVYLRASGRRVALAPARHAGEVKVTGTVTILGRHISASADAKATAGLGRLDIVPTSIDSGISGLDSASRSLLGQALTVQIPLSGLPFGQHLTGIDVRRSDITVHAAGSNVVLGG